MAAARFRMSRRGVGQLLRSDLVLAEMVRRAEVIKGVAEAIAPVGGPEDPHRGLYKDSFFVQPLRRGGRRRDRAVAVVGNTAPYGAHVEYGTERVRAHHVLLRAAQAGGR
ncbi:HK97 gp10 family phage protein [Streptomyces sp. adm13(2018)]|uniref:HK97 gp10 family phage protein n=1 Tax=Streptomyces sp. adm13(2018) TaxID=2479007 RepID=UPI0011CEAED5|nr:HK97 gp10 family phage protein [Streptomyces sp. adm13(2018)]TXS22388.1 HK97 gp10 family phage protein [Streptomyces sp. adm13(2018)]